MTTTAQKQSESLHARVRPEILEDIDHLAESLGRSRNWILNEALKQYLELQKWQVDLIKERLADASDINAKFSSHTEVMKRHQKRLKEKLDI